MPKTATMIIRDQSTPLSGGGNEKVHARLMPDMIIAGRIGRIARQ
jgi:hypothetical protein